MKAGESVKKVEQDIAGLLPDVEMRKRCLSVLLESLSEAHLYGAQKWGVYCRDDADRLRLLVGSLIVLTIHNGRLWMALDQELLETSPEALDTLNHSIDWSWETGRWARYTRIPSRNGYYTPSDEHPRIWPVIRSLHFAYIRNKGPSQVPGTPPKPCIEAQCAGLFHGNLRDRKGRVQDGYSFGRKRTRCMNGGSKTISPRKSVAE